jgi:bifunctional DNA-binding transcriptional regulator/antitoxin component of YhaV-PrlF toxin-antitoxin module
MSGFKTKLTKANQGRSLRTTVPAGLRDHFDLKEGDTLVWEIDKIDGKWVAVVTVERTK